MRTPLLLAVLALAAAGCATDGDHAAPSSSLGRSTTTVDPSAAADGRVATAPPVPSAGCGSRSVAAVSLEHRTLPNSERWYLLTVPTAHDGTTPLPIVLDFHGLSEGADVHTRTSQLGPYAEAHGFIAVFPNGSGSPVHWDVGLDRTSNPDLVFVDQLLDQLETDLCVDTSRVYAMGLSNGALLSSTIACSMADRFTAVAPVAGLVAPERCAPARPMPVLGFHGTVDPILLFNGGVGTRLGNVLAGGGKQETPIPEADLHGEGYPANAAAWATRNGCTRQPTDTNRTATVIERTWTCPAGAAVVFDIEVGAGHSWPGSSFMKSIEQIVGPTDMSIDATDLIWRFFQRFALPSR